MKLLQRVFVSLSLCVGFVAQAVAAEAPNALIQRMSDEVLETLKTNKDELAGDPQKMLELIDTKILPHTNFERMTREAMGRHWAKATPEQQQSLVKQFRLTLVRTYSGAVTRVSNQKIQMRPLRGDPNGKEVVVRTSVIQPGGEPVQLDYRMENTPEGWKVYDVNVMGIWLVENYRNQFAQQINEKGIDGLIALMEEKNKTLASAAKAK